VNTLSINLSVNGARILCIGTGPRLVAKAGLCGAAGARLVWWREAPDPAPASICETISEAPFEAGGALPRLALIDTGDANEDTRWAAGARSRGVPVWIGSDTAASDIRFPATVDRGILRIAIDTGGRWPTVAGWARQRIEHAIPPGIGAVLDGVVRKGEALLATLTSPHSRRTFWYRLLDGQWPQRAHLAGSEALDEDLERLAGQVGATAPKGEVYLVGAGPGDPDLLTLKAMRLIGQADVVLYDRLVSPGILSLIRADAERVHVGKARARHTVPQNTINQMLVDYARQGKTVVRLKGGDPFVFGRGGEEIATLADAGIRFQVVPGITAATGCAAYAGIPLTHRDYAQSVRFVTGHLKDGTMDLPWRDLVQNHQTLVFYMGLIGLPQIARALVKQGMAADMPVALVSRGTTPEQVVVTGTLGDIAERVVSSGVRAPTVVIVGEVVRLRKQLQWLLEDEESNQAEP